MIIHNITQWVLLRWIRSRYNTNEHTNNATTLSKSYSYHHTVSSRLRFWLHSVIDSSSSLICLCRFTTWCKAVVLSKYESIIRPIKPVRPGNFMKNRCNGCDGSTWDTWEEDTRPNVNLTQIVLRVLNLITSPDTGVVFDSTHVPNYMAKLSPQ